MVDPLKFIAQQRILIANERKTEEEEISAQQSAYSAAELQRLGVVLLNLRVSGMRSGLGGKCLADFESGMHGMTPLVPHKFRPGDIVAIESYSAKDKHLKSTANDSKSSGVIYRVSEFKITIAFSEDFPEKLESSCKLTKLANEITYQRMLEALDKLEKNINTDPTRFEHFFDKLPLGLSSVPQLTFFNENLNAPQKEGIQFALGADKLALIHGPPGTGKTHTCIEIIRQLVAQKQRVLVCGPSNISVDNIVERLVKTKIDVVRIGHPARLLPVVLDHCLDVRIRTCDEGQLANDVRKEMDDLLSKVAKTRSRAEKRDIYQQVKALRKELRFREAKAIKTTLHNAQVILSTLNGSASKKLDDVIAETGLFDVVLIDEASQALEAESWIAVLRAKKIILAGDHLQLPPTVKSTSPSNSPNGSLERTMFDRLLEIYGEGIKKMLTIQYRMHQDIMTFSSQSLYDGKLVADGSVKDHLLRDLPGVQEDEETDVPLIFMDTSGFGMYESLAGEDTGALDQSESKLNEGEAKLLEEHIKKLVEYGVPTKDMAVISPYNAQVALLRSTLRPNYADLEIGSIDGFQGREKEVILLSMVRSNEAGEVGFLSERRRLNVAITRPRRQLFVVADGETLSRGDAFLKSWISWLHEHAEIRFPS